MNSRSQSFASSMGNDVLSLRSRNGKIECNRKAASPSGYEDISRATIVLIQGRLEPVVARVQVSPVLDACRLSEMTDTRDSGERCVAPFAPRLRNTVKHDVLVNPKQHRIEDTNGL